MKTKYFILLGALSALICPVNAQDADPVYTNFIKQIQLPEIDSSVVSYVDVEAVGQISSPDVVNEGGARFELYTVLSSPLTETLLDTRYVGIYVPLAEVALRTEDLNSPVLRTRADRPFYVDVTISGLREGVDVPEASKKVIFNHYVQSYGEGGDGTNLVRTQTPLTSVYLNQNKTYNLTYSLTVIPGADRAKVRGEERFTVYSLKDFQAEVAQLASKTVQIWPVANGTISGIADGATIEFSTPTLTLAINDIYPDARVYAQVYKGEKRDDGHVGTVVPGSAVAVNESVPQNRLLTVTEWDSILTENGTWTMELLTFTPFGIDRLDWVTFNVDRTITIKASVTNAE